MPKIKIYKINEPRLDYTGQVLNSDYAFKDIVITETSGTFILAELNSNALFDALVATPEFLKRFGYEMKPIEKEKAKAQKFVKVDTEETVELNSVE